jgi:glycosyltransferase involved in cell wall biosynthesis
MQFSIIVPVYKVEPYIIRCLQSIQAQTVQDFELIVVDDCTPDLSAKLAEKFLSKSTLDWKIIHHEKNGGLSAARNSGIKRASGDWILFVDSDDELPSTSLSSFSKYISNCVDIVVGNYQTIYMDRIEVSKKYSLSRSWYTGKTIWKAYAHGDIPVMAWNKLVRRKFLFDNNLFFKEGIYNEDELWTLSLLNKASSAVLTGEVSYHYFVRAGSIMTRGEYKKLESAVNIYKELYAFVKQERIPYLKGWLCRFKFRILKNIYISSLSRQQKRLLYSTFDGFVPYGICMCLVRTYYFVKK